MLICRSAAKVNLTLDVLSRRADGYHELQSVVHTVGLWDTLEFDFDAGPGLSLRCNDAALQSEDNLCLKAARAWLDVTGAMRSLHFGGLCIALHKTIPAGAGLGGGSGNAAATLLALNQYFDRLLDDVTLHRIAATLGADVPLFLHGGCVLMEGIGERLTPLPALEGWIVIVQPPTGLSTPAVYRKWDELAHGSSRSTQAMRAAVMARDLNGVAKALHNDLSAAAQACGLALPSLVESLKSCQALGASMSGSGSAVFAIFDSQDNARQALEHMSHLNRDADTLAHLSVAPFCARGVEFDNELL